MCSGGDKTLNAAEKSQAAFMQTLQGSFSQAFGAQSAILANLTKVLTDAIANPHGFDPKTLALMKTNASDTIARQITAAQTAAANNFAVRGSSDIGSGVNAQIAGSIAGGGAEELARENSNIDIQSGFLQNQNYWNAIQGLTGVASAYNPTGYAGAANNAGAVTADIGRAALSAKQASWQNAFGVVKGIAGLTMAASGLPMFAGVGGNNPSTPVGNDPTGAGSFPGA